MGFRLTPRSMTLDDRELWEATTAKRMENRSVVWFGYNWLNQGKHLP